MDTIKNYINRLIEKGGPEPHEYDELNHIITKVRPEEITEFRNILGPVLDKQTIQGWAFRKPYGYSGDHLMIEKIYEKQVSSDNKYKNWDLFFHEHPAPKAVRNRKRYFLSVLGNMDARTAKHILVLGCGPATGIKEYLSAKPGSRFRFDLADACNHAVRYAGEKLNGYTTRINLLHMNIIKLRPQKKYDLIWSGGLFDYVKDKHFVRFLQRYYGCLREGGEMIIGNFSHNNISRQYMEKVGDWYLRYRSVEDLTRLALEAGIEQENIQIDSEDLGINLFMHLKKE